MYYKGELGRELEAVSSIRKVFLFCAGILYEEFGESLLQEQEALMALSNMAISLYSTESAVYRACKVIGKNGLERELIKSELAAAVVDEGLYEAERNARKLLSGVLSHDTLQSSINLVIQEFSKWTVGGTTRRNRRIARHFLEEGRFTL